MKHLTFIRHAESFRQAGPPRALMDAMGQFVQKSLKDGTLVETGGLLPSKEGARIRLARGKLTVTDGPFTEMKEVIGGWAIIKADSKGEATSRPSSWSCTTSTGRSSRASPRCARCSSRDSGRSRFASEGSVDDDRHYRL